MSLSTSRSALLVACTAVTFVTLGHAPGAVSLRTREIETAISSDASQARSDSRKRAQLHR